MNQSNNPCDLLEETPKQESLKYNSIMQVLETDYINDRKYKVIEKLIDGIIREEISYLRADLSEANEKIESLEAQLSKCIVKISPH